ncbi:non-ribosomal peptide synthetase [Myxococcus stipitatus DSM 14675]|uniref:Non-ribosomal peptide synthetase n=1 Tax=Myxococcus stipitatus (strain DSM 14675 / JCM 12634 / Mx s8) TaxID=1278073 RepID=L7U5L8_MYXSD|nr:non-ribosomal peptide synthetase [Myxococcus stipitatus]AGC43403.1 non-ribosomal peptide synthetase [Myxococcus stipitatus DSM 14675]
MSDALQKRLAGLSPEKRELVLKKLRQQQKAAAPEAASTPPAIPQAPRTGPLPLSYPQRRLWFLDQFEPGTPAYNIPEFVRLRGPLQVQALTRGIVEVVHRHEVLRTTFASENGEPVQHIAPRLVLDVPVVDLTSLPLGAREARCQELALREAGRSFDLAKGPLLAATLVRLGAEDHVLLLVLHHIISDGWSTGVLVRELAALYDAFSRGQPSPLPALAIQYGDFAVWQRRWLQGEVLDAQLGYWRGQLADGDAPLKLPTDRPRPRVRTYAGGKRNFAVDAELTRRLRALAGQEKASLYMVLLAAFQAQLHRYTREPRLSVGTYIANRNRASIEPLIGFFLNTLVMRTDMTGNPRFRDLLRRVVDVTLGAYAHQDVPFEKLLEELAPTRDTSFPPFFQAMLVLQNTPEAEATVGALRMEPYPVAGESFAQFDITLWLAEEGDGLQGTWEYNRDLFDATTADRMVAHFQTLLAGIAARPDEPLSTVPLLPTRERERVLREWNAARLDVPEGVCLHHLIAAHAARTPDALAVVDPERRLTYAQLDRRANQLAQQLRSMGVRTEQRVAICLERSVDLVVAVLAVLKAGGTYVPLDPSYPPDRTALMLSDSRPALLVTRRALRATLPEPLPTVVSLDDDALAIEGQPDACPPGGAGPEHLAYVVYTSGSTGRPKGVMVGHRGLANAYFAWEHDYRLPTLRAHLQMASFSFDVFSGDLARALGSGAALVLCPREWLLEPASLYALMRREHVDCGEFVPAVARLLMAHLQERGERLDFMRLLIVGSDTWDLREYHQLRGLCGPDTRLVSSYGLSEATIDSTFFESPAPVPSEQTVPIGRPFPNAEMYLLDSALQPAPIGVPGELFVGGVGLARGYWEQPGLTAERFVPHPFSAEPGARLYRTGDLARYAADGTLEFIGRNDTQVKLRGHRIELDEIRAKLLEHADVRAVELLVRGEGAARQLVAYLTLVTPGAVGEEALRQHLRQHLPPYMVPAAFVLMDAFPLTPNGKVDRNALPPPGESRRDTSESFIAPRDETERKLAALFEELLGTGPIGAFDSFFDLGGHSLLAVRLVARIREHFGKAPSLAALFQGPTPEHLARVLDEGSERPWSPLVTLQATGEGPPLFCVPGAGGNVLYFRELTRQLGTARPLHGFQAKGLDGEEAPHASVEEMAECYVQALQRVRPHGPYHLLGHSFGSWVAFEMAQRLRAKGEEVAFLGLLNTPVPRSPEAPTEDLALDDAAWMASVASVAGRLYGVDLGVSAETIRPLTPEARLVHVTERLTQKGLLPPDADTRQVRGLIQVYKRAYEITYVLPTEAHAVPITLFRAQERHEDDGVLPGEFAEDSTWGWRRHAEGAVTVVDVPGDHMTMLASPHVEVLAERMRGHLEPLPTKAGA